MLDWIDTRMATALVGLLVGCVLLFAVGLPQWVGGLLILNAIFLIITRPKNNVLPFKRPTDPREVPEAGAMPPPARASSRWWFVRLWHRR